MCRVDTQLGLRDTTNHHAVNFRIRTASAISQGINIFNLKTTVESEENLRAVLVIKTLDSTSTLGAAWRHSLPLPLLFGADGLGAL